ncbi:MAG: purine-nucleoside phosphorylase [Endomicrobium sp.]|jgi:purine-nucleoside phosphorylase|nr:purine-nucleoside phosphorylase [Endomicrobium sp.]
MKMVNVLEKIQKTKKAILPHSGFNLSAAVIAGSGLGELRNSFTVLKTVKYSKIPYFAKTTVKGHDGELHLCRSAKTDFLIFNGRFHFYEGHSPEDIIYPIRVVKMLGAQKLIITAAAGAVNKKYHAGDAVILSDHINFTGTDPLRGKHFSVFGERFPNMSSVYDLSLRKEALKAAKKYALRVHEGIYFGVSGPSYETPAAVKAYEKLGADIVGMSVVYEAEAAVQMNMRILGLVYVSNMAAGIHHISLKHEDVLKTGKQTVPKFAAIIKEVLEKTK